MSTLLCIYQYDSTHQTNIVTRCKDREKSERERTRLSPTLSYRCDQPTEHGRTVVGPAVAIRLRTTSINKEKKREKKIATQKAEKNHHNTTVLVAMQNESSSTSPILP